MKGARVGVLTAIAALGLVGLTACGNDSPVSAPEPNPQGAQAAGPRANLVAQEVGSLGMVLTDKDGLTLYRFDKDTAKPAVSNCYDTCEKNWPPLLAEGKQLTFTGVDQKMVGTTTRKDGTKQVTINGWPMYTYAKDTQPGDANGQGMGGTWYAATPEGKKAQGNAPAASQPPQSPKPTQQSPKPTQQSPANNDNSGGGSGDTGYGY
jgi:predicted lipoprotein with Yx(FWY)xxD motif